MIRKRFLCFIALLPFALACNRKEAVSGCIKEFAKFELGTVEYVVSKAVAGEKGAVYKGVDLSFGDKKILYTMTGTVKAGINLDGFDPETGVQIRGNSITLNLPKAQVLVLNIAPASIKYEFSKVSWFRSDFSEQDREDILKLGEQSIRDAVPAMGILEDAQKNAVGYFTAVLKNMGFKNVEIRFI